MWGCPSSPPPNYFCDCLPKAVYHSKLLKSNTDMLYCSGYCIPFRNWCRFFRSELDESAGSDRKSALTSASSAVFSWPVEVPPVMQYMLILQVHSCTKNICNECWKHYTTEGSSLWFTALWWRETSTTTLFYGFPLLYLRKLCPQTLFP